MKGEKSMLPYIMYGGGFCCIIWTLFGDFIPVWFELIIMFGTLGGYLIAGYRKLGCLLLVCSVNFPKLNNTVRIKKVRVGKNADANAIVFNSLIQFAFCYCVAILFYTLLEVSSEGFLPFLLYCVVGIAVLFKLGHSVRKGLKLYNPSFKVPFEYYAVGISCWFLYAVAVYVGEDCPGITVFLEIICICIWMIAVNYYAEFYLKNPIEIECNDSSFQDKIIVYLKDGKVLKSKKYLFYFVIPEKGSPILLYRKRDKGRVHEVNWSKIDRMEGISGKDDFCIMKVTI